MVVEQMNPGDFPKGLTIQVSGDRSIEAVGSGVVSIHHKGDVIGFSSLDARRPHIDRTFRSVQGAPEFLCTIPNIHVESRFGRVVGALQINGKASSTSTAFNNHHIVSQVGRSRQ